MIQIEKKQYLNGVYVSKGLGTVIFLFYFATFITVILLSAHFTLLFYKDKVINKYQTCSVSIKENLPGNTSENVYNINYINLLNTSVPHASICVKIHLKNENEKLNVNLKNLNILSVSLNDKKIMSLIDNTSRDGSKFQIIRGFNLKQGGNKLCVNLKEHYGSKIKQNFLKTLNEPDINK